MTDKNAKEPIGWIFYDAECALCLRWLRRAEHLLNRRNFKFVPLQTTWAKERLGLTPATALAEMRLLRADGRIF
ncbi:MAG: DCC1-like thiol-disulfide oxidoreductase family protein, partial [Verrucomicrobiota bacterium]